mmetsp:Transcript_24416/g.66299  ORF Transcript_24416/g.66299 Transcript_24416/m.66299 type:complete len:670 (-) Transcript_24416:375-2384(-)
MLEVVGDPVFAVIEEGGFTLSFGGSDVKRNQKTLYGYADEAEGVARVRIRFTDGTEFANFIEDVDWIPIPDLVTFASAVEAAISISGEGVLTLRGNYPEGVTLTVSKACDASQLTTNSLYANLWPRPKDVDLGQPDNLYEEPLRANGDTLSVQVRIHADNVMTTFQVILDFDDTKLRATSCTQGSGWPGDFECTLNDPANQVAFIGNKVDSTTSGTNVIVADIDFDVLDASATATMSGTIVKLIQLDANGNEDNANDGEPIVAGEVTVILAGGTGRRRALAAVRDAGDARTSLVVQRERDAYFDSHVRRRLQDAAFITSYIADKSLATDCGNEDPLYGDLTRDGQFNAEDVFAASVVSLGMAQGIVSYGDLCAEVQNRLDYNRDGSFDLQDILYLLRVAVRKLHFVTAIAVDSTDVVAGTSGDLVVSVSVNNYLGEPVTSQMGVRMEMSYNASDGDPAPASVKDEAHPAINDHWVLKSSHIGNGVWQVAVHAEPFWYARVFGVAIMLETTDTSGAASNERYVSMAGASVEPYGSNGIEFTSVVEVGVAGEYIQSPSPPPSPPPFVIDIYDDTELGAIFDLETKVVYVAGNDPLPADFGRVAMQFTPFLSRVMRNGKEYFAWLPSTEDGKLSEERIDQLVIETERYQEWIATKRTSQEINAEIEEQVAAG